MARRWTVRLAACVVAAPLLLAGCSGKQQANDSLPATKTATTTKALPALGPADLPMPSAAMEQTASGFNEFTKYYVSLINRLSTHLDGRYLQQFSRDCETCARLANEATSDASKGYRYEGGIITITAIAPAHLTNTGAETAFTVDQAAYSVIDGDGKPVEGLRGQALTNVAGGSVGAWASGHWVLTNLSFG